MKQTILLLLTDRWCDWEASYAIAVTNSFSDYQVKTIAEDLAPKRSMGGLSTAVDFTLESAPLEDCPLVIVPGGLAWEGDFPAIAAFLRQVQEKKIPIAAICGATLFLCRNGFLDSIAHTGDNRELFAEQAGYQGHAHYREAQLVFDGGIITANETAAVEFAYEIFKLLQIDTDEEMAIWFENFQKGAVR